MDRDKRVLWAKKFGGTQSNGGNEVSIDSQDNIVLGVGSNSVLSLSSVHLTSTLSFPAAADQDAYLFSIDPLGELLWARRLAGARTERAKSMYRWLGVSAGWRGGPPNRSAKRSLVIVNPVQ